MIGQCQQLGFLWKLPNPARPRSSCPWAAVYYAEQRRRGESHAYALRALGQRWLKILWKMLQTNRPYDPNLHAKSQLKHGSWVLNLLQAWASLLCR